MPNHSSGSELPRLTKVYDRAMLERDIYNVETESSNIIPSEEASMCPTIVHIEMIFAVT
jgi:hypothetical protein